MNPDVKEAGFDPWVHYVSHGYAEGRSAMLAPVSVAKAVCPPSKPAALPSKSVPSVGRRSKDEIFFSIIMPTYNRADIIERSIDSVLAQTFSQYELIIADDGSTDNTEELIHTKYKPLIECGVIRFIKCEHKGVCHTRNTALSNAKYEWIVYVDSDNSVRNYFLDCFASNIIEHPSHSIFYAKFNIVQWNRTIGREFSYTDLLKGNYIDLGVFCHHISFYRKYGGFDPCLKRLVDWDLILTYTRNNTPYFIRSILMDYEMNDRADRISVKENHDLAMAQVQKKHSRKNITTCITTYNHEKYIRFALESALMQTGNINHHIIVFDDCSIDKTADIVREYVKKYPGKIFLRKNDSNIGMARNMEQCFSVAEDEYIAILEGDDFWTDERKLEKQALFLDSNLDCSMCFSAIKIFNHKTLRVSSLARQDILPDKLRVNDVINSEGQNPIANFSSCMFKKSVMISLPEKIYEGIFNEIAVCFHVLKYGEIGFIREYMSVYRQHEKGLFTGKTAKTRLEYMIKARTTALNIAGEEHKPLLLEIINNLKVELERLK